MGDGSHGEPGKSSAEGNQVSPSSFSLPRLIPIEIDRRRSILTVPGGPHTDQLADQYVPPVAVADEANKVVDGDERSGRSVHRLQRKL
ncbi:hypothetical protein B296_00022865 [Ensete ventricosum]|uniref:Uncharacterized protein n=1 Tax=Ensete ventricosum TaxID=4639 RepID=A0A427AXL7_ENSVE|nr:hypothetical protein B296_00022865 [Ensete ventricosum]